MAGNDGVLFEATERDGESRVLVFHDRIERRSGEAMETTMRAGATWRSPGAGGRDVVLLPPDSNEVTFHFADVKTASEFGRALGFSPDQGWP